MVQGFFCTVDSIQKKGFANFKHVKEPKSYANHPDFQVLTGLPGNF